MIVARPRIVSIPTPFLVERLAFPTENKFAVRHVCIRMFFSANMTLLGKPITPDYAKSGTTRGPQMRGGSLRRGTQR